MHNIPIWDDTPWKPLPALEHDLETDVCVIGLGGSGLSCIVRLLELGQRVVGLDAGMVAGGAAGRNGGFLLAGLAKFYHDTVTKLGRERASAAYRQTMLEIDRMTAQTPSTIRRVGSLRIATNPIELEDCKLQMTAMQADGLPVQWYSGLEGEGLLIETDGAFNPLTRCRILARDLMNAGAQLFENSSVTSLSGNEVCSNHARVICKKVIVAVDGKLEILLPELTGWVRTARLQMLAVAPTTEVQLSRPVYARWGYEYWQQLPNGSISLGGFRDAALEQEWTSSNQPSEPIQGLLEQFMREKIGVKNAAITHRWAASVSYSSRILPVLQEVRENLWAIGGYSGTGNVVGALLGRIVAELAVTGSSANAALFLEPG
jgi:glycine/D-amino acid oxidase-like deaminating enzyme